MAANKDNLNKAKGSANLEPASAKAALQQLSASSINEDDSMSIYESQDEDDDGQGDREVEVVGEPPRLDDLVEQFTPALEEALVSLVAQEPGQTHASALTILNTFVELESQREELDRIGQELEEEEAQEQEEDEEGSDDEEYDSGEDGEEREVPDDDQRQETVGQVTPSYDQASRSAAQPQSVPIKTSSKASSPSAASPARTPAAEAAANAALARFGKGTSKSPLAFPPPSAPRADLPKKAAAPLKTLAELGLARPDSIKHATAAQVAKPVAARTGPGGRRVAKGGKKSPASPAPARPSPLATASKSFPTTRQAKKSGINTLSGNVSSTPASSPTPSPANRAFMHTGIGQSFSGGPQLDFDPQTNLALKLKAAGRTAEQIERAMRAARSAEIRARGLSPAEQAIAEREAKRLDADTLEKVLAGHIVAPRVVIQQKKGKKRKAKYESYMPVGSHLPMFARKLAKTQLSIRAQAVAASIAAARRWQSKVAEMDEEERLQAVAAKARAKREEEEQKEDLRRRKLQEELEMVTDATGYMNLPVECDEQKLLDQALKASQGLPTEDEFQTAAARQQKEKERKEAAALLAAASSPSKAPKPKSQKQKKSKNLTAPSTPSIQTSGRGASAISQRSIDAANAARSVQASEGSRDISFPSPAPLPPMKGQAFRPPVGVTVQAASSNASSAAPRNPQPPLLSQGLSSDWDELQAFRYLKDAFPDYTYEELADFFDDAKGDLGMIIDRLAEKETEDMHMQFPSLSEQVSRVSSKSMAAPETVGFASSVMDKLKKGFQAIRLPGAGGKDRSVVSTLQVEEVVVSQMASLSKSPIELRNNEINARKKRREALRMLAKIYKSGGPTSRNQMEEFKAVANSWERKATIFSNAAAELEVEDRRRKAARRALRRTLVPVIGIKEKPILKDDLPSEIDLHHLTVREAEFITKKYVESWDFSSRPELKVITGAGIHSKEGIAKIKPKIYRWLGDNALHLGIDVKAEGNGWFVVRKMNIGAAVE